MKNYAESVNQHYGGAALTERILKALTAAGIDVQRLTVDDLQAIQEFHIGGRDATLALAELAKVTSADHVLDVGCGIGGPARALVQAFGCRVTGVDLTDEFCRTARSLNDCTQLGESIDIRQANALDLPFDSDSFDVVWTQHVNMNIADKRSLFAELNRCARSGGRVAMHEIFAGPVDDLHLPVPWARDPNLSFLVQPPQARQILEQLGLQPLIWNDVTREALMWFEDMMQRLKTDGPSPLSLATLMGEDFPAMAANVAKNLKEDRLRIVQAVFTL